MILPNLTKPVSVSKLKSRISNLDLDTRVSQLTWTKMNTFRSEWSMSGNLLKPTSKKCLLGSATVLTPCHMSKLSILSSMMMLQPGVRCNVRILSKTAIISKVLHQRLRRQIGSFLVSNFVIKMKWISLW